MANIIVNVIANNGEQLVAYDDTIFGTALADALAGDAVAAAPDDTARLTAGAGLGSAGDDGGTDGGDSGSVYAFNDTLHGRRDADLLAGDVLGTGILAALAGNGGKGGADDGEDGGAGGEYNEVTAFDDLLLGGAGNDVLVGDVLGAAVLDAAVGIGGGGFVATGGNGGDNNAVDAFNDKLFGNVGRDTLVGDADGTWLALSAAAGNGGEGGTDATVVGGAGGDGGTLEAFNDEASGGRGGDLLTGDVVGDGATLVAGAGLGGDGGSTYAYDSWWTNRFGDGGAGGFGNRGAAFNDLLSGAGGVDEVVGDVRGDGGVLVAAVGRGGASGDSYLGANGGRGGDANAVEAFSDGVFGGRGADLLTGDVSGMTTLTAAAGDAGAMGQLGESNGRFSGDGGDFNALVAFGDSVIGGGGSDNQVGDVRGSGSLVASTGLGGVGEWDAFGGNGGDANDVQAFNDSMVGDAGADILVGDVHSTAATSLSALVGLGGKPNGGAGGSDNLMRAFGDNIAGGTAADAIVGDVVADTSGAIDLAAAAGNGGANWVAHYFGGVGAPGGDGNTLDAFADLLQGGSGADVLVGDVQRTSTGLTNLAVSAGVGDDSADGWPGGHGNVVTAFNDSLAGEACDDLLVGDVLQDIGGMLAISIEGQADNSIAAFQDNLLGGDGNDRLYGDLVTPGGDGLVVEPTVTGDFTGRATLFADTLSGGLGDDLLVGGLGADLMSGETGADTFAWLAGDLFALTAPAAPPLDLVSDFGADDVLDIARLLDSLGYTAGADIDDWLELRPTGATDSTLAIDQDGAGDAFDFADMVTLVGFHGSTLTDMIDQGQLLL